MHKETGEDQMKHICNTHQQILKLPGIMDTQSKAISDYKRTVEQKLLQDTKEFKEELSIVKNKIEGYRNEHFTRNAQKHKDALTGLKENLEKMTEDMKHIQE